MTQNITFSDRDDENQKDTGSEDKITHTGSGGAFDGTEAPAREEDRDMSDEQLDERLENKGPGKKKPPAY
ncbi:hypothetical protein [Chitinophaga tropicalis]|uniref:Uncharacterized protein n=1 Tax=Chitinophaga tropicalis TaxID=2683588 RepID=A0A7K1U8M3_9BACT|nr:hypothetical protein [Chitinophaga tropicalis]MVT10630.1 hypothetical protein [Chitinophaga tropicalis]